MASRPFAFSSNNTRLGGTENVGRILIGEPTIGFQAALENGIRFFMGPEEVPGKIIACFITTEDTPFGTNTSPAIGNPIGGPTAYFAFEELDSAAAFVSWVEEYSAFIENPIVFDKSPGNNNGENDALTWCQTNEIWTNFNADPLPTATSVPPTATPHITPTPVPPTATPQPTAPPQPTETPVPTVSTYLYDVTPCGYEFGTYALSTHNLTVGKTYIIDSNTVTTTAGSPGEAIAEANYKVTINQNQGAQEFNADSYNTNHYISSSTQVECDGGTN